MRNAERKQTHQEKDRHYSKTTHLLVVEVGVDGRLQLGLVILVVEFEDLPLVLLCLNRRNILVIALIRLAVHHLDLVVEQPHSGYLILQLEGNMRLLEMLCLSQLGYEHIEGVGVLVYVEHFVIKAIMVKNVFNSMGHLFMNFYLV